MILVSSIICKNCFTRIFSRSVHDYQECPCGAVSLDGGLDYMKVRGNYIDSSIFSTDIHARIRQNFQWGSRGKKGDEPLRYILLRDMELSHIGAILETQKLKPEIKKILLDEINFRMEENER